MSVPQLDQHTAAAAARSILSCARDVELDIADVAHSLVDERLGLLDIDGTPGFLCPPQGVVAASGRDRSRATLMMTSGVRGAAPEGDPTATWSLLFLRGTLRSEGVESCTCCVDVRERVVLDLDTVEISDADGRRVSIPVAEFHSQAHALNRGYLQRAAEHAREAHQHELREAVAELSRTDVDEILGAQLVDLTTWGTTLEWVDLTGSHQRPVWFPRVAETPADLAALLRGCLHPGIC
ncbi:MAG: hypothetical protein QM572_10445 [Nocardioides sp.]|uniref:hypothetical protein n=1 Tax=Nocardioides sp. TaxID=35761 RepID=UPI0039E653AA